LTKGQYTQVSTDGKVIIRLPEAEKLLTRFWAKNKMHKNCPSTLESLPNAVPNSSMVFSTSTNLSSYELLYPPSPTPFLNIKLLKIQKHPENAGCLDPHYFEGAMEAWYPTLLRMTYRLVSSLEHLTLTQFPVQDLKSVYEFFYPCRRHTAF